MIIRNKKIEWIKLKAGLKIRDIELELKLMF